MMRADLIISYEAGGEEYRHEHRNCVYEFQDGILAVHLEGRITYYKTWTKLHADELPEHL